MSHQPQEPTEEELRAALEQQLEQITPDDVLRETVVSLLNLGARRAGLVPGGGTKDLAQTRTAIEAVRALMPFVDPDGSSRELAPVRDAIAQLQLAFARDPESASLPPAPWAGRTGGGPAAGESGGGPAGGPGGSPGGAGGAGAAQRSGRLWVPGQ